MVDLAGLTRTYLREWFLDNGAFATLLGAEGYDRVLGDFSAAAFERRERRSRHWFDTFAGLGDAGLSLDDRVDRDVMLAHLRGEAVAAELPAWRRDPSLYLRHCQLGVISLFGHRPHAEPELVSAAVSRLRQIPEVLDHARRNLDEDLAAPMVVRRSAAMAVSGLRLVRAVVLTEVADPALRRRLVEPGLAAARAFAEFANWLIGFRDRARGDWRLGERRYTALLRDRDLLDVDAAALCDRGRTACDALDEQLREVAARVACGSADWRTMLARARDDHPATPDAMLAEYEAVTMRARNFLVDHDLVSFGEGEQCQVVPAPPFSRMADQVASYLNLPVLSGRRTGRLYVPYPPDGATPEVVEQRLRANSRVAMPTVVAHDVYPGHHWHRSSLVGARRPVRIVLGNAFFGEGWSLYGEHMMREHGFFADPAEELAHLEARIFRAARIVVDTSLHCGEMSTDEAAAFLASTAPSWADVAGAEVARYCTMPTHAASYLTGALEIERIRDRWRKEHPDAPLREFHDRLAGAGELPLGLAERLVLSRAERSGTG